MITYNPKDWFKLIFQFHKSDTVRILFPTIVLLGLITGGVCFVEKKYLNVNVPAITIFHQICGFVISLVLVFRINTAYDRWWEGRKLWGSLINNSRNIGIKMNAIIPLTDMNSRAEVHTLISNFAFALKEHLRNNNTTEDIKFTNEFREENYVRIAHKPNYIAKQLTTCVLALCKKYAQSQNDYLILSENLNQLTEICGACERIRNTPIPYSYSLFIKKIIFIYIITMPFTFGLTIGYWSIPMVIIVFYAFASLELISEEIEDPFGLDPNDLPTDEMSVKIKESVREILLSDGSD